MTPHTERAGGSKHRSLVALASFVVLAFGLPGCGGSSSETPWPLEPLPESQRPAPSASAAPADAKGATAAEKETSPVTEDKPKVDENLRDDSTWGR